MFWGKRTHHRTTLVLCAGLILATTFAAAPLGAQPAPGQDPNLTQVPEGGEAVPSKILEGKVLLIEFLRFIQRSQKKPVYYPSVTGDPNFQSDIAIDVLGDIEPLTYPIVKSMLEANGYEIYEQRLEDGSEVIHVRHSRPRQATESPNITKIEGPESSISPEDPDQLSTLVLQLKYADTNVVLQALRELLDVGAQRTSGSIKIVNITTTQTLIIKAKRALLRHIQELVTFIDIKIDELETLFEIIPIYNADAQELVTIIEDVLNVPAGGGSGRSAARGGGNRQGGQARPTPSAGGGLQGEEFTRLIADIRTQKIIVQTTSEEDLELIMNLIDELDSEVENLRPSTNIYRVKFLKAEDLANDLQALLDGTRTTGGLTGRGNAGRGNTGRGGTGRAGGQQGQQQQIPSRVIAHDETNSLIVQAEYEEYLEVLNILEGIDIKRRQVFLEAALVQVNQSSSLNYILEYLAGELDDESTRVAALSAFGLTTINADDLQNNNTFDRQFVGAPGNGLLAAVSRDGQLPVLLQALKSDTSSAIIATPFILADDNQTNEISIQTEIFFQTSTLNDNFSQGGQDSEEAGVTLTLTPTISRDVVLLDLALTVSAFTGATTGETLPDRNSNTITSRVTIPDGQLFIIGGLSRETQGLAVEKVPILGDLPLIGRFFQSRSSTKSRDNLYVFLSAHILSGEDFTGLRDLSRQAFEDMQTFDQEFRVQNFENPPDDRDVDPEEAGQDDQR